ncbi:MAG: beta strand repeat-containing protein [Fimbriiglobus sp.]
MKRFLLLSMLFLASGLFSPTASAQINWLGTTDNTWTTTTNWQGGVVPTSTDVARWNSASTVNLNVTLGGTAQSIAGLIVANPTGTVSIGGTAGLTLGASGIDMTAATQNLTITTGVVLANTAQTWNVASGRVLTLGGVVSGGGAATTLSITGGGSVDLGSVNSFTTASSAGSITIDGATVRILAGGNVLGNNANRLTMTNGAILDRTTASGDNRMLDNTSGIINLSGAIVRRSSATAGALILGTSSFSNVMTITGGSTTVFANLASGGEVIIDSRAVINNGATLELNAISGQNSRFGGSQSITINAGGAINVTGAGNTQFGGGAARQLIGEGSSTSGLESTVRFQNTGTDAHNGSSTMAVNGTGTMGLRFEGTDAKLGFNSATPGPNWLAQSRINSLTGSGGTLTIALSNTSATTQLIERGPSVASNVRLGLDRATGAGNITYTVNGTSGTNVGNWGGLVVKGDANGAGVTVNLAQNLTFAGTAKPVDVLGGTLNINGTLSGVSAITATGGLVGGTGTYSANATFTNATLRGDSGTGTADLNIAGGTTTLNAGTTGATLFTQLLTSGGAITDNSKLLLSGASTDLKFDGLGGANKFNIVLGNDAGLTNGTPYTIILATANAGTNFLRNTSGTDAFLLMDFTLSSGTGAWPSFTDVTLLRNGNNLELTFTPVPEPGFLIGTSLLGMAVIGMVRRRLVS